MRTSQRLAVLMLVLPFLLVPVLAMASGSGESGAAKPREEIRIKGWQSWSPAATAAGSPKYTDHVMFRIIEEKFRIFIDWTTVASEGRAALGLLLASGDLPDLIAQNFGPTNAQDYGRQGAFITLEDLVAKHGPNLTKLMKDQPAIRGQTVAPDGHIYFFPRTMEELPRSWPGYQIRKDWLESLGLKMPDTLADFEKVLVAFRDRDPNKNGQKDEIPWTTDPRVLLWPFGIGSKGFNSPTDMFVEDGVVKFGPTDSRFKEAVTFVARWYREGLIDPEYLGQTTAQRNALVLGNKTGAMLGSYAGYLTANNELHAKDGHPDWKWVAMPSPAGPTGIRNMMGGHKELDPGCGASITVASKYPTQITEMMDYFYSKEGRNYLFYGMPGLHYNMVNDGPVYTNLVAKDPNLSIMNYLNTYVGFISVWPSILPNEAQLSLYAQEGKDALYLSAKYETDRKIPNLQFTAEEIKEVQQISRDLDTLTNESVHAFIRGQKSLDKWDTFQADMKQLKCERLTALYNQAYGRYKKAVAGG